MVNVKKIRDVIGPYDYREKYIICAIFIFAFIIRILYLNQIKNNPLFDNLTLDPLYYDTWAKNLLITRWVGSGLFCRNHLYPYFLATIFRIFGHNLFLVRLFQHVLGSFSCVIIYLIGKKLFNKTVGIIAMFIMSIYSLFIFYESVLVPATLFLFLISLGTLLLISAVERGSFKILFFSGVVWSLSLLTQISILPLFI